MKGLHSKLNWGITTPLLRTLHLHPSPSVCCPGSSGVERAPPSTSTSTSGQQRPLRCLRRRLGNHLFRPHLSPRIKKSKNTKSKLDHSEPFRLFMQSLGPRTFRLTSSWLSALLSSGFGRERKCGPMHFSYQLRVLTSKLAGSSKLRNKAGDASGSYTSFCERRRRFNRERAVLKSTTRKGSSRPIKTRSSWQPENILHFTY